MICFQAITAISSRYQKMFLAICSISDLDPCLVRPHRAQLGHGVVELVHQARRCGRPPPWSSDRFPRVHSERSWEMLTLQRVSRDNPRQFASDTANSAGKFAPWTTFSIL